MLPVRSRQLKICVNSVVTNGKRGLLYMYKNIEKQTKEFVEIKGKDMRNKNELVIFETKDNAIRLEVPVEKETVWLTQAQMIELFERDQSVISRHINNAFKEELDKESNMQKIHIANSDKPVAYYSLDVVISVGCRVKSNRGVEFRKWANSVLKQYILQGYAVNHNRIAQLGEVIKIMKRTQNELCFVLYCVMRFSLPFSLLKFVKSYGKISYGKVQGKACLLQTSIGIDRVL